MKFANNNDVFAITKFISFFINKSYHFRMIFDSNLDNYEIIKERLLIKQNEFIVEKMNRIIEYVKTNVIDVRQKMIARINKIRLSVNFEIEDYVWLNRRHIKTTRSFDKLNDKKLNWFKVIKKHNIVYELKLFDDMHIHSVFHFWLLRKDLKNSLKKQQNNSSKFVIANEMFEWELNDILQSRYRYHRLQYRCKWSNWNSHDRTLSIKKCSVYSLDANDRSKNLLINERTVETHFINWKYWNKLTFECDSSLYSFKSIIKVFALVQLLHILHRNQQLRDFRMWFDQIMKRTTRFSTS